MERVSDNRLAELIDQADNLHLPGTSYVEVLLELQRWRADEAARQQASDRIFSRRLKFLNALQEMWRQRLKLKGTPMFGDGWLAAYQVGDYVEALKIIDQPADEAADILRKESTNGPVTEAPPR